MREIGTTAGFLEIGDTFKSNGVGDGPFTVTDLAAIDNRPNEMIYQCVSADKIRYRFVLKTGAPIVLCLGGSE